MPGVEHPKRTHDPEGPCQLHRPRKPHHGHVHGKSDSCGFGDSLGEELACQRKRPAQQLRLAKRLVFDHHGLEEKKVKHADEDKHDLGKHLHRRSEVEETLCGKQPRKSCATYTYGRATLRQQKGNGQKQSPEIVRLTTLSALHTCGLKFVFADVICCAMEGDGLGIAGTKHLVRA